MLIIIDQKAPDKAKYKLSQVGKVVEFATDGICYDAISGHPDIFFFQWPGGLVVAPNLPGKYKQLLQEEGISFQEGAFIVGQKYPFTAHYNALYTSQGILHNTKYTDPVIKNLGYPLIHCRQGYVRCNTLQAGKTMITSDRGIEKVLTKQEIESVFVEPSKVLLKGVANGFFGGCCGFWMKKLYICGSLNNLPGGEEFKSSLEHEIEIIPLYNGPLMDVGGIMFIKHRWQEG